MKEVQLEVIGQRVGRSGDTPNIINGVVDGGEAPESESNEKGKENNFICEYCHKAYSVWVLLQFKYCPAKFYCV